MVPRWQTLVDSEAKSRMYLSLTGRELNVMRLKDDYHKKEDRKHFGGYTRKYIGKLVR